MTTDYILFVADPFASDHLLVPNDRALTSI
jgi:hypothetical protein